MVKKIKEKLRWFFYKGLYKPGHYYSTIPDLKNVISDSDRIFKVEDPLGIDLNKTGQLELLRQMANLKEDFQWPEKKSDGLRYYSDNSYFILGDAFSLFCLIRILRPKKIIEIGSGFSSAVMIDTNERFQQNQINITFIEPFPERLNSLINPSDIKENIYRFLPKYIQEVNSDVFDALDEGDILFIDSSHVSKIGSDLNHILFQIIPRLKKGVYIHFHDIFYPLEYPMDWISQGIYWNEMYLLRAFLMFNSNFEVVLFNNYWSKIEFPELNAYKGGGSLWLKKIA